MLYIDLNTLLSVNWKRLMIIVEFVRRKRRRSDVLTEIENIIDFVSNYYNLCLFLHCLKYIQYCKNTGYNWIDYSFSRQGAYETL